MPNTRVEIPEISNRRLGYLARRITPVISFELLPLGRWPRNEVVVHFVKLPKDLRQDSFLRNPEFRNCKIRLTQVKEIHTLHVPGSAGRFFYPTIAEVLAQISAEDLDPKKVLPGNKIIAFETFLTDLDPEYDSTGRFHVATTVLLAAGSPDTGRLQRLHYT